MLRTSLAVLALALCAHSMADTLWPGGKKVAVVLTYDDTLASHLDVALPQLDERGLPATFYLSGARGDLINNMARWRAAAEAGHELGNHTLYHPCRKGLPGRDWVQPHHDLDRYSVQQYVEEIQVTNTLLHAIDGETVRTFAYTCGDELAGGESVVDAISPYFIAARSGSAAGDNRITADLDYYRLDSNWNTSNPSLESLIASVEAGKAYGGLVTFCFHGVGADYLATPSETHAAFLDYLSENQNEIWVTTLRDAVLKAKSAGE